MKLTAQQMQQLENCSSAEEIMTLAKKANINITMEQAQKAFDLLGSENIPEDFMQQVTGGEDPGCLFDRDPCTYKQCGKHSYWS